MQIPDPHMQARAQEADRILNGPVFSDAMNAAKEEFVREWLSAGAASEREAAWAKTHALEEVQRQLRRIVSKGTVAGAR